MEVSVRPLRGFVAAVALSSLVSARAGAQAPPPSPAPPPRPAAAAAQPGTDIFILDLSLRGGAVTLGKPVRLTDRAGYDNQPYFSPDGRSLYYTAIEGGQSDIQHYDFASRKTEAVARTPE